MKSRVGYDTGGVPALLIGCARAAVVGAGGLGVVVLRLVGGRLALVARGALVAAEKGIPCW